MRIRAVAGGALVAVLLSGCAAAAPPGPLAAPTPALSSIWAAPMVAPDGPVLGVEGPGTAAAVRTAVADFRAFAERESLGGPVVVSFVLSTSAVAELRLYQDVPSQGASDPVVVMAATGRFGTTWEKLPAGFHPRPVRHLSRIVPLHPDAAAQSSGGGGDAAPDLAALGTVVVAAG